MVRAQLLFVRAGFVSNGFVCAGGINKYPYSKEGFDKMEEEMKQLFKDVNEAQELRTDLIHKGVQDTVQPFDKFCFSTY
eukprot:SAG11_NODE_9955_length_866_cov_1.508475_1_plen_79_part_00